eukprot:EG_transcript_5086
MFSWLNTTPSLFSPFLEASKVLRGLSSKPKTEDDFFKIERSKHGTYMLDIFRKAGLQKGDIFLISDADEIPRVDAVRLLKKCGPWPAPRIQLEMPSYIYSFQRPAPLPATGCSATIYDGTDDASLFHHGLARGRRAMSNEDFLLHDAGWHCQWCFRAIEDFVSKITRYSHRNTFLNLPDNLLPHVIQRKICEGQLYLHGLLPEAYTYTELALLRRPNADSHSALNSPEFVRSNPRRFEYLLNKCTRVLKANYSQPPAELYDAFT